jgi:hypothetical protein
VYCSHLLTKVTDHELHFSPSVGDLIKLKQTCILPSPVDQGHRSQATFFPISRGQDQIKIDSCLALTCGLRLQITSYIFPQQSGRDQIKIDLWLAFTSRSRSQITSYIFPHQLWARSNKIDSYLALTCGPRSQIMNYIFPISRGQIKLK